ncbi:acyl-CoA dehydrogenase [Buttiauxella sp. B2]|uniref:FAS1-like dehydratase domain-containing protein n=1 Tax=Buttiauxella sp. B2 TaxID=2587812 RepID=UPI00111FB986|nr:MaoC family dehydratase N-terminal domain-containing protein [Buttiauxella sp. B2]TNV10488.1 acyl-CoA dehydrogenase [Buttiauxella sp. B2]
MSTTASWHPEQLHDTDYLATGPANRLAAMFDSTILPLVEGDALPELWHWLYFLPADRHSALATDGHPEKGHFLPPVSLPRRMWAASRLLWHSPFKLGEQIDKTSRIKQLSEKNGRSGKLVFVDVEHRYTAGEREVLTEVHTIVYRESPSSCATVQRHVSNEVLPQAQFSQQITADPRLLFRYSALTFNTHRIHYDLDYVKHAEGYPGLVVHGPLTATLLVNLLRETFPGIRIRSLQFKALTPLFSPDPITLSGRIDGDEATLWACGPHNLLSMKATALLN